MDEDTTWYGSRPRPSHIVLDGVPALCERGTAAPLFLTHVCCGHGRPSQLLLSSCQKSRQSQDEAYKQWTLDCSNVAVVACATTIMYTAHMHHMVKKRLFSY